MSISPTTNVLRNVSDIETTDENNETLLESEDEFMNLIAAADRINKIETELHKARSGFRNYMKESSESVKSFSEKLGSCVEKAKKFREVGLEVKSLLSEAENVNLEHEISSDHDFEKAIDHLQQEFKKSINKSCLSTRRSLLQLNNLANQHQLQLLPYFEMKTQFNQMFEEEIKKVSPLDSSNMKRKINYDQFHIENSNCENFNFEDSIDDKKSNSVSSKTSNSGTSSYQDSLSSENIFLEELSLDDRFLELPSSIKLTPGLVNCTVGNGNFKSLNEYLIDDEDLSFKVNHEGFVALSNGTQSAKESKNKFNISNNFSTAGMSSSEDLSNKSTNESGSSVESEAS